MHSIVYLGLVAECTAAGGLFIAPVGDQIGPAAEDRMIMVREYGETRHVARWRLANAN